MSKEIKVLLYVVIIVVLSSLGYVYYQNRENKSLIDKNIEEWIKKYAHNPDSYEPIKTELIDSISKLSIIEKQLEYEYDKTRIKKLKLQKDSLLKTGIPIKTIRYIYMHECRIKVPLGGLMLKKIRVVTDTSLNIIEALDEDKLN